MSAFVVSHYHVDALVSWAMAHRAPAFPRGVTPASLGSLLHEFNCLSVESRYDTTVPRDYKFTHRPEAERLSPVAILKACDCLEYQSCELSDWADTQAADMLDRIRRCAVSLLPGYDDAAWALDEVTSCA